MLEWKNYKDWFKQIWDKSKIEPPTLPEVKPESPYKDFAVEHYPATNRYYPIYKDKYLYRNYSTGLYSLRDDNHWVFVQYASSESDAWKIVDAFKESSLKCGVRVLRR